MSEIRHPWSTDPRNVVVGRMLLIGEEIQGTDLCSAPDGSWVQCTGCAGVPLGAASTTTGMVWVRPDNPESSNDPQP